MTEANVSVSLLVEDEEEVLGEPSFELWVRDGSPIVSGSYFIHPPLRAKSAVWDAEVPGRLVVEASDGSRWTADDVPLVGSGTVVLRPSD